MKNLLMIIPFFPPMAGGGVYRPLSFVKHLGKYGWRPTVIAPDGGAFWIRDETLLADIPPECEVHRTTTLSGQRMLSAARRGGGGEKGSQVRSSRGFGLLRTLGSLLLVPDTYVGWYPFAVRAAKRVMASKRIDAVYSTSPPETSHLVAHAVCGGTSVPWVADFRDPWMNLHLFPPATPLHRRAHERMEKKVCTRAQVIVTNAFHRRLLEGRYPGMGPVRIITNGFDMEKLEGLSDLAPPGDRFRILHAGMLTQKRSAVPFLQGLGEFVGRRPEVRGRCEVLFLGPREDEGEQEVERLGLGEVVAFRDTVPHVESLRAERTSHILLLIKHLNPVYRGIIPGKLYEYIGARRPILALVPEGDVADLIRDLERGDVAPQDDPSAIADCIEAMYDKFVEGRLDDSYNLAPAAQFARENLSGALARCLDEAVRNGEN